MSDSPNKRLRDKNHEHLNNSINTSNEEEFAYPPSPEKRAKKTGLFPLEIEENSHSNRIPQAPGSVGATALSGLSIYSPKANNNNNNNNNNVSNNIAGGELVSPKSDFNAYVDNALSPLGIGMSPSASTPSDLNNRVPTSKDWPLSQSPFVGGFPTGVGEEFAFSDVGSPPPRMRHKGKRFDDTSPGNLLSPSNLMMSPLGPQDESHVNNKKALEHRMKGDNLRGQLTNSSQLFLNPVKTDLLSGGSPSKHKLGIAESSDSLGFAAITEAARSMKQKTNVIGTNKSGSNKKNDNLKEPEKSTGKYDKDEDVRSSMESDPTSQGDKKSTESQTPTTTYAKTVSCNCKKSKCLKLYCDCFRISKFCDGCNCVDCANNLEHSEGERAKVINAILERNPEAFKPRVMAAEETTEKCHLSGCHCKKSACLKKYCECFTGGVPCNSLCRCIDCKNSQELYANGELIGIKTVVSSSTKKVTNSNNSINSSHKNDEELNNSRESTSSPINTLLELAGAGVNEEQDEKEREATESLAESLLALSPKPSRTQISDMNSSHSDQEESIYKTEKKAGGLFI